MTGRDLPRAEVVGGARWTRTARGAATLAMVGGGLAAASWSTVAAIAAITLGALALGWMVLVRVWIDRAEQRAEAPAELGVIAGSRAYPVRFRVADAVVLGVALLGCVAMLRWPALWTRTASLLVGLLAIAIAVMQLIYLVASVVAPRSVVVTEREVRLPGGMFGSGELDVPLGLVAVRTWGEDVKWAEIRNAYTGETRDISSAALGVRAFREMVHVIQQRAAAANVAAKRDR